MTGYHFLNKLSTVLAVLSSGKYYANLEMCNVETEMHSAATYVLREPRPLSIILPAKSQNPHLYVDIMQKNLHTSPLHTKRTISLTIYAGLKEC